MDKEMEFKNKSIKEKVNGSFEMIIVLYVVSVAFAVFLMFAVKIVPSATEYFVLAGGIVVLAIITVCSILATLKRAKMLIHYIVEPVRELSSVAEKISGGELDIEIAYHVVVFGGKEIDVPENLTVAQIKELAQQSEISVVNQEREQEIKDYIDQIKKEGDTIGGVVETVVGGVPVGLGSYVQWDTKLDAKIAQAVVSINAFKGVEFGLGFKDGYLRGSQVMDEILWNEEDGYTRRTNNLGGFEGGMTNGQPIVVRGVMKPIPTLYKPLMSVDIETHEPYKATVERSDPTALPAAGVVMESVVATVVANEILDKFSSDNLEELKEAVAHHRDYVKNF